MPVGRPGPGTPACANGQKPVLLALLDTDKTASWVRLSINGAPAAPEALDRTAHGQVSAEGKSGRCRAVAGCPGHRINLSEFHTRAC